MVIYSYPISNFPKKTTTLNVVFLILNFDIPRYPALFTRTYFCSIYDIVWIIDNNIMLL